MLDTAFRVSELVSLDLEQYEGKHFRNVKRKGNHVTDRVFVGQASRDCARPLHPGNPRQRPWTAVSVRKGSEARPAEHCGRLGEDCGPGQHAAFARPNRSISPRTCFATRHFGKWPRRRASGTRNRWLGTHRPSTSGATSSRREARWKRLSNYGERMGRNCTPQFSH